MNLPIEVQLEALLFAAGKPVAVSAAAKALGVSASDIEEAVASLVRQRNTDRSGIQILAHDSKLQLASHPEAAELIRAFLKEEISGELTRPSLETLTVIAYRGPMTKPELEQIRGVNCALILRNLLLRGLIEEREDRERLQPVYTVSMDFLRHLGLRSVDELPEFERYRGLKLET